LSTFSPRTGLFALLGWMVVGLLAGCVVGPTAPNPAAAGPPPPLAGPEALGRLSAARPVDDLLDAMICLASGQPVYGLMQGNGNVRTGPSQESCRVGRAPADTVIRVEGLFPEGQADRPLARLGAGLDTPLPIGYQEDIRPLFQATCQACHGPDVQNAGLQVTEYSALMAGSERGPVIQPGDPEASLLWQMVHSGAMPLIGELSPEQKRLVYDWILLGAPEQRPELPSPSAVWALIGPLDFQPTDNNCGVDPAELQPFVNAGLFWLASCAAPPDLERLAELRDRGPAALSPGPPQGGGEAQDPAEEAMALSGGPNPRPAQIPGTAGIQVAPLGLPAPSDGDPWMVPQGGFCLEQRRPQLAGQWGITSLAFAPDGRLFIGLDGPSTGQVDPNVLFDAFHPSRALAVYQSVQDDSFYTILENSSRITGLVWHQGVLYVSRAGEIGAIPDGGSYQVLAQGFAVNGRIFHANNGVAIADGWLYVSAGGIRDGYSDGVIAVGDGDLPAETLAVNIAAGGNPYGARIVRAPLERLRSERRIELFQTAARGVRNPYGITADPYGRIWFTDNGATNVPGEYTAGDEVNLLDPRILPPAAVAGDENATPFYGFPLELAGVRKDWYTQPVLTLENSTAPTGITWAYDTIFFALYGRNPGLYRLANAGGTLVAERVLYGWPIQAVATAPDGAIWFGTGDGGLYRLAAGCGR